MKRKSYILAAFALAMAALFAGCRKEARQDAGQTTFEAVMTNEDSVAVVNLIDRFFGEIENGDLYSAVAMLYKADRSNPDPYAKPLLLDNDEMEALVAQFKAVPVYGHKIDYVKFNESYLNEAKCTVTIRPAQGNLPAATMVYYLKPVNYLGGWVLCLMNTNTGDQPVVDNDDKDSLERHYQERIGNSKQR